MQFFHNFLGGREGHRMLAGVEKRYDGLALLLVASGLLGVVFRNPIVHMVAGWHREEYSHGYLIPVIAALIAWHRLTSIRPMVAQSWSGAVVVALAMLMLVVGDLAAQDTIGQYGLLVAMAGVVLALLGAGALRAASPALVYLLFAIPLPQLAYIALSTKMQLWSTDLGALILQLLDIPVYQEGNVIDLGEFKLQVVDACSGLRYLFPLASFGFLAAYLVEDAMWKRVLLFLSVIPIAIVMNALRIGFIGVTVDLWGQEMARGFLHDFEGWSIFLACSAILLAEASLLIRIKPRGHFRTEFFRLPQGRLVAGRVRMSWPAWTSAAVLLVVAAATLSPHLLGGARDHETLARREFSEFPGKVGDWVGQRESMEPDVLDMLHFTDYLLEDFSLPSTYLPVNFYVAYYADQQRGYALHSPANCIPGGGWEITSSEAKSIELPGQRTLLVNRVVIQHGEIKQLVYYWFDQRGLDLVNELNVKWQLFRDTIKYDRSDGSLIRLVTPVDQHGEAAADARLTGFLGDVLPVLTPFLPAPIAR